MSDATSFFPYQRRLSHQLLYVAWVDLVTPTGARSNRKKTDRRLLLNKYQYPSKKKSGPRIAMLRLSC